MGLRLSLAGLLWTAAAGISWIQTLELELQVHTWALVSAVWTEQLQTFLEMGQQLQE